MSFRTRLTLLYAMITGGMLLIFGVLIFFLIDTLINQEINATLESTYQSIQSRLNIDSSGRVYLSQLPTGTIDAHVYVQVWDMDGNLSNASGELEDLNEPLDPGNFSAVQPTRGEITLDDVHMRVLTVPLRVEGRRTIGVVQVATPLVIPDLVKRTVLVVLIFATAFFTGLSALVAWGSLGQILIPLRTATATANQVGHADDLSRRIPYSGRPDEIGQLIEAFNRSLARLERLFNSQQRFLADVSHELRTPLTVIKLNADLIRKMGPDRELLDSITEEADRLRRLVGDLLLLANAESGKLTITMKPVELDTVLIEVMQEMGLLAGERVQLKLMSIDQVQVNGDRDRLKQVFINLISNAIKYTPQGGDVSVDLQRDTKQVRVDIHDTGPGIPPKDLPHIFDRFYRGEKSRTRAKTGGYGLGLSIANWIVDKHGGSIEVQSLEGQGSTFSVLLPLAEAGVRRTPS